MYLRFDWVAGNIGLIKTIVIVLMASSITFITGLSASAIATNIKVGVGGEYYLISRSLGLEPGGAIGIPLYLCRTLSVTVQFLKNVLLCKYKTFYIEKPRFLTESGFLLLFVNAKSGEFSIAQ